MDQPKIPTLKDSQKPQVKLRGLSAGATLFDRLKQFKKKDLAFILAGLGTLMMAPLAEHFMMAPETGDAMNAGPGGGGGGRGIFGGGRSPYEQGDQSAVGGPSGGGSDVITPLNVRDPSSLIMGPGSAQQPPTQSAAPTAPPPAGPKGPSDADLKDALAASAVNAASAAVKKAPLPVPKIGLNGSTLRGLGVATGGSSSSAGGPGLAAPAQANFSRGGGGTNMPGVKGGGNIAAVTRGQTTGGSGLDALKAAADKAGNVFNRAGSAGAALNAAASQAIPTGGGLGSGAGQGGASPNDKAGSGNSAKESKSAGESLAYQMMKENMEKQLELYWKEKEAMDPTLELYKIRNSMAENVTGAIATSIGQWAGTFLTNALGGPSAGWYVCGPSNAPTYGPIAASAIAPTCSGGCTTTNSGGGSAGGGSSTNLLGCFNAANASILNCQGQPIPGATNCGTVGGGGPAAGPAAPAAPPAGAPGITGSGANPTITATLGGNPAPTGGH
jgi:hypothetical protein